MDDNNMSDVDRLTARARNLAIGLADTGLSQAEEMLRRVSPEGRAQARREREARARVRNRIIGRIVMVSLVAVLALYALAMAGVSGSPIAFAVVAAVIALAVAIIYRGRARPPQRAALVETDLHRLPADANAWLSAQKKALPAPAVRLADDLGRRLEELQPQLARLSPQEPAAEAVRKLVATELPALVEGWRGVPPSLRARPQADGRTPDAQLADGLALIDGEVARMTEQLARGALDEVATQGRYLELKYRG